MYRTGPSTGKSLIDSSYWVGPSEAVHEPDRLAHCCSLAGRQSCSFIHCTDLRLSSQPVEVHDLGATPSRWYFWLSVVVLLLYGVWSRCVSLGSYHHSRQVVSHFLTAEQGTGVRSPKHGTGLAPKILPPGRTASGRMKT